MYWDIRKRTYSCGETVEDVTSQESRRIRAWLLPLARSTDLKDVWRRRL